MFVNELNKELGIDSFVGAQSERDEPPCHDYSVHGDDCDNAIADFLRGALRGEVGVQPEEPLHRNRHVPEERAHRGLGTGGTESCETSFGVSTAPEFIDGENTSGEDDDAMPKVPARHRLEANLEHGQTARFVEMGAWYNERACAHDSVSWICTGPSLMLLFTSMTLCRTASHR